MATHLPAMTVGFDADDTLWHNENIFERVHERYRALLSRFHDAATVDRTLFTTEKRNLELYGYGIKGFTLSCVETAIELSSGEIRAEEIATILSLGKEMLAHPVELLEGVAETIAVLAQHYRLLVITKGDLRDQERKFSKSGIAGQFYDIEIVSEKDQSTYAAILKRHGIDPGRFVMVGNSLKSDILPIIALGGIGVHIPYPFTWAHEHAEAPSENQRVHQLASIRDLPALLTELSHG